MWNKQIGTFRINNREKRVLYEAGSPNQEELSQYQSYLEEMSTKVLPFLFKNILVLGMTPYLRLLAHSMNFNVISMDKSKEMIDLFADWIPSEYLVKEKIIQGNWLEIPHLLNTKVDAVLGDGIFANLTSLEDHQKLLTILKNQLNSSGVIILRKILIPESFNPEKFQAEKLLSDLRKGNITDAEFGLTMRIFGNFQESYNFSTFILDNKITFDKYTDWYNQNKLSSEEIKIIRRYFFEGKHLVLPQKVWENLLKKNKIDFEFKKLKGKLWYDYFFMYNLQIK